VEKKRRRRTEVILPHVWEDIDIFDWKDKITDELLASSRFKEYAKYWDVLIVQGIKPNSAKARELLGTSKTRNYEHLAYLSGKKVKETKKRHAVYGYIIHVRGEKLFEQFVIQACKTLNIPHKHKPRIPHKHKPRIKVNSLIFEDDLLIGENIVVNLKCGEGLHTYQPESYKTTQIFAQNGYEAFLLYYDLETNLVEIFDTEKILSGENIAVGMEQTNNPRLTLSMALKGLAERLNSLSPPAHAQAQAQALEKKGKRADREEKEEKEEKRKEKRKRVETLKKEKTHVKEVC